MALVQGGPDVCLANNGGQTPLHNICKNYSLTKGKSSKNILKAAYSHEPRFNPIHEKAHNTTFKCYNLRGKVI